MTYKTSTRKQPKSSIPSRIRRKDGRAGCDLILPTASDGWFSVRHTDGVRVSKPHRPVFKKQKSASEIQVTMARVSVELEDVPGESSSVNQNMPSELMKRFQLPTLVLEVASAIHCDISLQPDALDALQQACTEYLGDFLKSADLCKLKVVKDANKEASETGQGQQDSVLSNAGAKENLAAV